MNKLIAFLLLFLSIPIFFTIFILLYKHKPIFFFQDRIGKDLKVFKIIKFRTMESSNFSNIEYKKGDDLKEKRKMYKTTNSDDLRITKLGKYLRKYHLDELPQIINILKGDMNFIGPRPDVPVQEFDYIKTDWLLRNSIKPGITGLSQVSNCNSEKERQVMDIFYVKNKGFWLNSKIFFLTILKIFKGNSL
ncbi:MAG: sugar transferase [Gammaproteobacteria bacterium]